MQANTPIVLTKTIAAYKLKKGQRGFFVKKISSAGIKDLFIMWIEGKEYSLLEEEFEEVQA